MGWLGFHNPRIRYVNGIDTSVVNFTTGECECFVGDHRVLVLVQELHLRRDRSYHTDYPPGWKWYNVPGRKC